MMWFRRKTVNLADSVANQKINFNNLLEKYMELYSTKCDGNTIARDANEMLSVLRKKYPLTSSDIAIIWLILLSFDKDKICSTLSISSDYYYQRRCKIRQTLNFESTKNLNCDLKSFVPKYLSEHASTIT